jgi:hypothetical protein
MGTTRREGTAVAYTRRQNGAGPSVACAQRDEEGQLRLESIRGQRLAERIAALARGAVPETADDGEVEPTTTSRLSWRGKHA